MSKEGFFGEAIEWNDEPAFPIDTYKSLSTRIDADLRIHNVLALAVLESDEKINLDEAVKLFINASYVPEIFPAVRIEVRGQITGAMYTISLFDGGRIQSAGGCMPREAGLCMKRVARRLRKGLNIRVKFRSFEIHNLLGVVDICKRIDLNKMYQVAPGTTDYEPSKFPALRVSVPVPERVRERKRQQELEPMMNSQAPEDTLRRKREAARIITGSKKKKVETITASIFTNGKINFVGGKSVESIVAVLEELKPYIDACSH
ncbi:putative transcription factor TFIID, protein TBP [Gregarina niphandrodes]|uniref:Transcription factor TFIID, protein TBP n=1 Tax=Gregarina niphandrodes TaxID=110365 RepID=A0A023BDH1_GRENI|nr:putative transcription factor TFIID, protein TBP [Gregarina niphandrodes]EZG88187.1 putative transcription factor TFIID, protein TBP [Gregarina niphandrodes]|eukprot:XP_011128611.1 putative transcription factor TFIID, protein TBP [Gregarina niphandrodes]